LGKTRKESPRQDPGWGDQKYCNQLFEPTNRDSYFSIYFADLFRG
jgi:hypothetical protein